MSETVQRFWCDGRCSVDAEDGTHVAYEHLERALLALATVERERDSLRAQLTASQAETLGLREERDTLRERVSASATGMATLNDRIAELEQEREDVRCVEAWLRESYSRRIGADGSSLPDAKVWATLNHRWPRGWEADSLAALGRMLKEGENG